MTNYALSVPDACKAALEEYKEYNDPIRQFIEEIVPKFAWDLVPFSFLYELYTAWYKRNFPGGSSSGKITFLKLMKDNPDWDCDTYKKKPVRTGNKLDKPEMMILEYRLSNWMNPVYTGNDQIRTCIPGTVNAAYNGMVRRNILISESDENSEPTEPSDLQ